MFPLRGLWNRAPVEGDQFVNVECDWLVSPPGNAVQFALAGNSPVALSQIVALYVDNGRCGVDVDFIFPDSGFVITVPTHAQGLYPVLTNALMFYASAQGAALGDVTIFQILNSMPPPIQMTLSQSQNHASVIGQPIAVGALPVVAAGINGTLNTASIDIAVTAGATNESGVFELLDGAGNNLWTGTVAVEANSSQSVPFNLSGLSTRFLNGLNFVTLAGSTLTGSVIVNVYYTTP